jgi:hypothetical protein
MEIAGSALNSKNHLPASVLGLIAAASLPKSLRLSQNQPRSLKFISITTRIVIHGKTKIMDSSALILLRKGSDETT